jgi:hypothetical protein
VADIFIWLRARPDRIRGLPSGAVGQVAPVGHGAHDVALK